MATVNSKMSIKEVLQMDGSTAEVFLQFGMACLSCPYATAESLAEASAVHGVDADALVEKLNAHIAAKG